MEFIGTFWAIVPAIIAIALALITKEVYLSLFLGVLSGALFFTKFNLIATIEEIFGVMSEEIGDGSNIGILIFLVFLGSIVALMSRAGGSAAYGKWANNKIKTRRGALLSTFGLGALIFVDDYFNCLTVGSVMRPVTDSHNVSRAKLAYIIDATAAPICIIAPISSWAAAVTGYTEGDGFALFLNTIPFNLYAWLTIAMVIFIATTSIDFGPMKRYEDNAAKGDIFSGDNEYTDMQETEVSSKGKVIDLVLPIVFLIVSCVVAMLYTGELFAGKGVSFIDAFANCSAAKGLFIGSLVTLVFVFLLYIPRKIITFKEFAECLPQGFKMMVPAILILVLAWSLGSFCSVRLDAGGFISGVLGDGSNITQGIFPAILFVIGLFLAFATGTSWATFGILIPIIVDVFPADSQILVICISSVLAGAVCGDHISPISDTTIMASAGAQCNHINHVSTQIPYALFVAGCCFVGYLVAGFTENVVLTLVVSFGLLFAGLLTIKAINSKKA